MNRLGDIFQIPWIQTRNADASIGGEENGKLLRQALTLCSIQTRKGKLVCSQKCAGEQCDAKKEARSGLIPIRTIPICEVM